MLPLLLAVFIITPLVELYVLITVGAALGAIPTILLELTTAALGGYFLQRQGLSVLLRVRTVMAHGEMPALELLDGALLLLGGLALLLPGLITDAIGGLLLIPWLRRWLIRRWITRYRSMMTTVVVSEYTPRPPTGRVLDTEYRRE